MSRGRRAAVLLAALVLPAAARAHDTWLLALRAVVPPGAELLLDLTSGMRFPANETAVQADRVEFARVRLGGLTDTLLTPRPGAHALRFRAPLRRPGVAVIAVELRSRELSLDSSQAESYMAEIGAPDSVRTVYLRQLPVGGVRRWRERYAKHAKAVVRVTSPQRPAPAADSAWREPTGAALEIVPAVDPTAVRPGGVLLVRLLAAGQPVAFTAIGFTGPAAGRDQLVRTDATGRAAFPVAGGGRWMVRATMLRRSASPALDWESDFATLTGATR